MGASTVQEIPSSKEDGNQDDTQEHLEGFMHSGLVSFSRNLITWSAKASSYHSLPDVIKPGASMKSHATNVSQ
jgi:hypothetical protein